MAINCQRMKPQKGNSASYEHRTNKFLMSNCQLLKSQAMVSIQDRNSSTY
eukprot:c46122_g1_i1 orf=84-233(+)